MSKSDFELVDEYCKLNNLYGDLESEADRLLVRQLARDTFGCTGYILNYRLKEFGKHLAETVKNTKWRF